MQREIAMEAPVATVVHPVLQELLDFFAQLPDELQIKAAEELTPVAERLDEVWWEYQFSHTPPEAFKRMVEEVDQQVADGLGASRSSPIELETFSPRQSRRCSILPSRISAFPECRALETSGRDHDLPPREGGMALRQPDASTSHPYRLESLPLSSGGYPRRPAVLGSSARKALRLRLAQATNLGKV